jgi:FkbM family methyltransferase
MPSARSLLRGIVPAGVWERLRTAKVRRAVARYSPRWVRHRYGAHELDVLLADPMGELWYDHDWDEPPEFEVLRSSALRPGATVFDCGAHHGVVAAMLAREVDDGVVVAVEAAPHNAGVARQILDRNGLDRVEVVEAAVADRPGQLRFSGQLNGSVDHSASTRVDAVTIDELARRFGTPDVVFIDVEGFELHVLDGASETLRHRPDLAIEVHVGCGLEDHGGSADELAERVRALGYTVLAHDENQFATPAPLREVPGVLQGRCFLTCMHPDRGN